MSEPEILTDLDARGVATITLNRPDIFNAFNAELLNGLKEACEKFGADPQVRVVLVRGNGKHFSAGADINWFKEMASAPEEEKLKGGRMATGAMRALDIMPKPTIALVHNVCFGGGMGYVASCDIAIASEDAHFSVTEVRVGITPAPILPQLIAAMGVRALSRYALSGETFDAHEAKRIGFIHEVCPVGGLDEAAAPIIEALMLGGPKAIADTKRLIADVSGTRVSDEIVEKLSDESARGRGSPEGIEGFNSFLEKRKPNW